LDRPLFKVHEKDSELFQLYNKASEQSFSDPPVSVLPSASSPQAIQGMWQAYGQMRAARTTAGGAILASGLFAGGVFGYNKYMERKLKDTEKELENTKEKLRSDTEKLEVTKRERDDFEREKKDFSEGQKAAVTMNDEHLAAYIDLSNSHEIISCQLKAADSMVEDLCKGDKGCITQYNDKKNLAKEEAKRVNEERVKLYKQNQKYNLVDNKENSRDQMNIVNHKPNLRRP
jgi:hypothetical protein